MYFVLYYVLPPTSWVSDKMEGVVKTESRKDDITHDKEIIGETMEEEAMNINIWH